MAEWYFPRREAELRDWAVNFSAMVSADPGRYALGAEDAVEIADVVATFVDRYVAAADLVLRGRAAVAEKEAAKAGMIDVVRRYAGRVLAAGEVSAADRLNLGLDPGRRAPVPVPVPVTYPVLSLAIPAPLRLAVRVSDSAVPGRRAKPAGVAGCQVFVTTDGSPPADYAAWRFAGLATRGSIELAFASAELLTRARVIGRWQNRKGEAGPWSQVQSVACVGTPHDVSIALDAG